jgi:hypothetical protein
MVRPPGQPTAKRVALLDSSHAKEGTMNAEFWIELVILALRIFSAGLAG